MVDALEPFAAAFVKAVDKGESKADAWKLASEAAAGGAEATKSMVAKVGRAREELRASKSAGPRHGQP